jgi:rhamnogalacturonyl hydrolase YesR
MMTMNLGRLDIAAILTVIWAQAISGQTAGGTLLGAAQAVAALPGAPSIVVAAGLTRANERLLTLEEVGGIQDPARRLVIVGGLDGRAESAEAVLEALRWFKTDAPAMFRRTWAITALPCANPRSCGTASPATGRSAGGAQVFPPEDGFYNDETSPESRYLWRWVAFQAPDLVLEVRSGQTVSWEVSQRSGALRLDGPRPPSGTLAAAMSTGAPSGLASVAAVRASTSVDDAPRMLRSVLEAATSLGPSPLHDALLARVGRTPVEIATLLAHRYPASPAVSYIPAVAWSNTLRLAARLGDAGLVENVRNQMAPFLSGETPTVTEPYRLTSLAGLFAFVDFSEPGQSERALSLAIAGAQFMFSPSTDAILRSPTGWTDDMFMASSLLSRVGARTGDARYGATVGRLLTSYTENLQRPDGLFIHSAGGPHAWGRANGFALLSLTEALTFLPDNWAERPGVLDIYRRHIEALVRHQAPDGMWHQVVDESGSYRELTVTSMTLVALARGVRLGWLDDSYRSVIDRAWRSIATHIAEDGTVVDASTSTGAGETKQYYLDRTAMFGADERGGAMALWAAVEMDELSRQ